MRSLDTQSKRLEFATRLGAYFSSLKTAFELGDEDPQYLRLEAMRRRIVEKHKLPIVSIPSITGGLPDASSPASDAEERFLVLARTAMRNGQGTLTSAMSNMLEASRRRLGLSPERAAELRTHAESGLRESATVAEYREMFEAFFEDGQITDDERAILVDRQVELGLSQPEVDQIEAAVLRRNGLKV